MHLQILSSDIHQRWQHTAAPATECLVPKSNFQANQLLKNRFVLIGNAPFSVRMKFTSYSKSVRQLLYNSLLCQSPYRSQLCGNGAISHTPEEIQCGFWFVFRMPLSLCVPLSLSLSTHCLISFASNDMKTYSTTYYQFHPALLLYRVD